MTAAVQLAQSVAPGVSLGFKNRIINGAMTIDQRNAGAAVAAASGYTLDRWETPAAGAVWTVQQVSDAPPGFTKSMKATVTTASSAAGSYSFFRQHIEGYNFADMLYGSANAQTVTLSFWVKSSLTGTFGLSFRNTDTAQFYTTTYAISSANTWEQKSVTISGCTIGTWNTTNGDGFQVFWDTGIGSTYSSSSNNAWTTVGANYFGVTGVVKPTQTLGATFQLSGVQLEVGTTATPFEFRDYGRELIMCQRYYEQLTADSTLALGGYGRFMTASSGGSGVVYGTYNFGVTKRSAPTLVYSGTYRWQSTAGSDSNNSTSLTLVDSRTYAASIYMNASAGGTAGYGGSYQFMTSSSYVGFNSEL